MRVPSSYARYGYCKGFQVGLWAVWIAGFFLICLSLYSTQWLPFCLKDHIKKSKLATHKGLGDSASPTITIFSAPSPFAGFIGARQDLAIRSWLALSPDVVVVLFGQHPSIFTFAAPHGSRVLVESAIDFTFLGVPFYHSMVARSRVSNSDISVLIDPEIIILPDFISTLHYAHKLPYDWLLIAKPLKVSHLPFHLDEAGQHWLGLNSERLSIWKLQEFVSQKQNLSYCGRQLLLAWNTGELPLHAGVLPPFLYGKGIHDQWIVNEALSSDVRFVFDATEAMSSFYAETLSLWPNHFFRDSEIGAAGTGRIWEFEGNSHLATLYGSLFLHRANFSNDMVKLFKCDGKYLFVNVEEGIVYNTFKEPDALSSFGRLFPVFHREQWRSVLLWKNFLDSGRQKKWMACLGDINSLKRKRDCFAMELSMASFNFSKQVPFPLSLELLLDAVAGKDRSVVLAVAGNSYKDMLMSWVCRLRRLSISNFLVCALDHEVYQFSVLQGLPVFKDPLAPNSISFNDCHFGTKCFQRVTKVKSRLVLQILKMGYDVLMSDVDVYWFDNPLPLLRSFGPTILVAQSDEYKDKGPINLPRRLNSGFYFARSDPATIAALSKVVKHASSSHLSEQPSFYDVLCGEGGINRISDDRCLEPETNLTVHFLDRSRFPNGAYRGLWQKRNVTSACLKKGCLILHNNWISGRKKKLRRQMKSGLWEYDSSTRQCLQVWHKTKPIRWF